MIHQHRLSMRRLTVEHLETRRLLAATIEDGFRLQAVDFDTGGEGVAYHDTDATNNGGLYRPNEGVDIRNSSDVGGGYAVGWISDGEWLSYTVDITPGIYDIHTRIATGINNPGDVRFLMGDGTNFTELGLVALQSTGSWSTWQDFTLPDVPLLGGTDQVLRIEFITGKFNLNHFEFSVVDPAPTTAVQSGSWDDANTWSLGVPDDSRRAIIPQGLSVTLDGTSHHAKELVVQGTLDVAEEFGTTKTLTAQWIHANSGGVFQIGTESDRYDENEFVITLTGTDPTSDHVIETAMGTMNVNNNDGFLIAAMGARLQFFGADKQSFTKLGATASSGDSQIVIEKVIERNFDEDTSTASDGVLNWQVGDEIVVASSSYDYWAEDVRTITAIIDEITDEGDSQSRITLDRPLTYLHYGEIERYGESIDAVSANPDQSWDIDLRAEVSLLSRNIKITGLQSQDTDDKFGDRANLVVGTDGKSVNGIGANTMIMGTAGQITVDGVQFDMGGHTGRLGRYPFHWHFAGDRSGDVLRNSSITNSNNRGVVVHGTDNVLIEGVVIHDIHGHGFFVESGIEIDNTFSGNIAYGIHKVGSYADRFEPFVVDDSDTHSDGGDRFSTTSAYWVKNPDNTWIGNVVAGSEGSGWWFDQHSTIASTPPQPLLDAVPELVEMYQRDPVNSSLGTFRNNTVHSTITGIVNKNKTFGLVDPGEFGEKFFSFGDVDPTFQDLTIYKTHAGVYSLYSNIETVLANFRAADNKIAIWDSDPTRVDGGLIVGRSRGNAEANDENFVEAVQMYHGRAVLEDVHFAGFGASGAHYFGVGTGNRHRPELQVEGLTFEDDGSYSRVLKRRGGAPSPFNHKAIYDRDGSLTGAIGGGPGYSLVPNHPFGASADSGDIVPNSLWEFAMTENRFGNFQLFSRTNSGDKTPARITVTSPNDVSFTLGGTDAENAGVNSSQVERSRFQSVLDGDDYTIELPRGFNFSSELFRFNYINWTDDLAGASTIFRIVGAGNQMKPIWYADESGISRAGSLQQLREASETSDYIDDNNDLWIKLFVTHEDGVHSEFIEMVPATIDSDLGDAPKSYGTLLSDGGPSHVATGPRLGNTRDVESNGMPSLTANGDDESGSGDDDGVLFGAIRTGGTVAALNVDVQESESAFIDAWIDFDKNDVFSESEKILNSVPVVGGLQTLNFTVPTDLEGPTRFARVRISSAGGLSPGGFAADGEVEDWLISTEAPRVESIEINGGDPQRSSLDSVRVKFNRLVDLDLEYEDPLQLINLQTQRPVGLISNVHSIDGHTVIDLTFSPLDDSVTTYGSLIDGSYTLVLNSSRVTSLNTRLEGNRVDGHYEFSDENPSDEFFRRYGDANGDRSVGLQDFAQFRGTFGKQLGDEGYIAGLDANGDEEIGLGDFAAFRSAFGT